MYIYYIYMYVCTGTVYQTRIRHDRSGLKRCLRQWYLARGGGCQTGFKLMHFSREEIGLNSELLSRSLPPYPFLRLRCQVFLTPQMGGGGVIETRNAYKRCLLLRSLEF